MIFLEIPSVLNTKHLLGFLFIVNAKLFLLSIRSIAFICVVQ
jgi:hypothetical protein